MLTLLDTLAFIAVVFCLGYTITACTILAIRYCVIDKDKNPSERTTIKIALTLGCLTIMSLLSSELVKRDVIRKADSLAFYNKVFEGTKYIVLDSQSEIVVNESAKTTEHNPR